MSRLHTLYHSSLGKKAIVAATGAMFVLFLVLHLAGNLTVFLGNTAPGVPTIDHYARSLRTMGEPFLPHGAVLWSTRIVLLSGLALHVLCVLQLAARNRRARPEGYRRQQFVQATRAARWMLATGLVLLLFLVVHILQFTTGTLDASRFVDGRVYGNLQRAFSGGLWPAFYLAAMAALALHVRHGAWSFFQTLGLDSPDRNRALRRLAAGIAAVLALAFASVPIAFATGFLTPPTPQHAAADAVGGN